MDENEKIGYIDTSGKVVIPAQFDYLLPVKYFNSNNEELGDFWDDGYAVVWSGSKFGIIDTTGKYVVNPQFDGIAGYQID